ncbi:hypothetical protein KRM28CT15_01940 [Krasilnikovia sp. M28-CT-15]
MVKSLAEAYVFADYAWPRLIYDGDQLVGFLMGFLDIPWAPERDPGDRRSGLWRLNIAADFKGVVTGASSLMRCAKRSVNVGAPVHTSLGSLVLVGPNSSI